MKKSVTVLFMAALVATLASTSAAAPGHLPNKGDSSDVKVFRRSSGQDATNIPLRNLQSGSLSQGSSGSRGRASETTAAAREPKVIEVTTPGEALEKMRAVKKRDTALIFFVGSRYDTYNFYKRIESILEEEKGLEHHNVTHQWNPVDGAPEETWIVRMLLTPKSGAQQGVVPLLPPRVIY